MTSQATTSSRYPCRRPRARALAASLAVALSALGAGGAPAGAAGGCSGECTIWDGAAAPGTPSTADPAAIELGVRFRSDAAGWVTGVRFYKGSGNTGVHTGSLWDMAGNRLATATFADETPGGWQRVRFAVPVPVAAGVDYVASYLAPSGHYAYDAATFAGGGVDRPPLHAPADGDGGGNGLFAYGGGFPTSTSDSANYWVDVVFSTGPVVTGFTPGAGPAGAEVTLSGVGFTGVQSVTLNGAPVNVVSATATSILVRLNSWNTTGRFAVTLAGGSTGLSPSAFTVTPPATCPGTCTIWGAGASPGTSATGDTSAVELGVRFRTESAGWATGVRFYKGPGNTGIHTGSVWDASGNRLATATFAGETVGGWQQVDFATPVALAANTTYLASYLAPEGHYAYDAPYFSPAGTDSPPLHALRDGYDGPNGVYAYGGGFPSGAGGSANYWVDVVFSTGAVATGFSPDSGPPSSEVTISGAALNLVRAVDLNQAPVDIVSKASDRLVVRLHSWNTSGQFTLQTLGGATLTVPGTFAVTP